MTSYTTFTIDIIANVISYIIYDMTHDVSYYLKPYVSYDITCAMIYDDMGRHTPSFIICTTKESKFPSKLRRKSDFPLKIRLTRPPIQPAQYSHRS